MDDRVIVRVADLIGSPLCISADDGQKVFDKIVPLLKDGKHITISFERITTLISLFLNASIGQLYGAFTEDQIHAQLHVTGLDADDLESLKIVEDKAKKYYANPIGYDEAWAAESDDEE
jgi:hypothetical protein